MCRSNGQASTQISTFLLEACSYAISVCSLLFSVTLLPELHRLYSEYMNSDMQGFGENQDAGIFRTNYPSITIQSEYIPTSMSVTGVYASSLVTSSLRQMERER